MSSSLNAPSPSLVTFFRCSAFTSVLVLFLTAPVTDPVVADDSDPVSTSAEPESRQAEKQEHKAPDALVADTLFDPQRVVEVSIRIDDNDWDLLRKQTRSLVECLEKDSPPDSPFTYVKADVRVDGLLIPGVGIRKKGFYGSLDDNRPSLKIKFSEYDKSYRENPPIPGIDRLTLNNNKQDPAGASHLLGYRFFRDVHIKASRCNAAHVTVNGKDLGIYSNVESIRRPFLERNFDDGSGGLLEGTVTDFYAASISRFETKNNAATLQILSEVADVLDQDDLDLEKLESLIDLDAFIRFWATESLIGFWDGYTNDQNNFFMYQHPQNGKLYFIPWGVDCAFSENMPLPPFIIRPQFVYTRGRLANRLYKMESTRKNYLTQMEQLLNEHWDETQLLVDLDALETRVKPFNTRDDEFTKSLERIRKFIRVRRKKLTREIERGFELKTMAKIPPYAKEVGRAIATFDTKWYDESPENGKDLGDHELALDIQGERIEFRKMGVYAQPSEWPPRPKDEPKPPSLLFSGNRSNGKEILLGLGLSKEHFQPTDDVAVPIDGILIEGKFGWPGTTYKPLSGTVTFEHAQMQDGARVKGALDVMAREIVDPKR